MGNSESDIRKLATGAEIKNGFAIHGSSASKAEVIVKRWIMKG